MHFVYKKVAMVEQFFDIIYSVHVEAAANQAALAAAASQEGGPPAPPMRGRAGKHCGQKRTYRAVSVCEFILNNGGKKNWSAEVIKLGTPIPPMGRRISNQSLRKFNR